MAPAGVIDALTLPARREATEPPEARGLRRDEVRLLVSHVDTDSVAHSRFREPQWLAPGDLLVVNTSGTLKAALTGRTRDDDRRVSFDTPAGNFWVIEVRRPGPVASLPCRDMRAGTLFELEGGGRILSSRPTRSSADWKRSRDCGWRRLILQNRCCRISNDLATRFDTTTSRYPGRNRCTRPSSQLSPEAEMPSAVEAVHSRAGDAARGERHSGRAAVAAHGRGEPRRSRTTV